MNTVRQLLDSKKENKLITITPEQTTYEALQLMAEHDVGAVLVLSEGKLVGVLTEREYARKIVLQGKTSRHTPVGETMNRDFRAVAPDTRTEACMEIMGETHTRYLPVLDGSHLIGLISVGDVVRAIMTAQSLNIEHLERYITGGI
jgi:CBS domain-containing protein